MNKFIVVCDIDGTLADCEYRRAHLNESPPNWKAFNEKMLLDKPIKALQNLLWIIDWGADAIIEENKTQTRNDTPPLKEFHLLIVSGRDEDSRQITESWLHEYNIRFTKLFMRKTKDNRKDCIIKQEILDEIIVKYGKPNIVFDDRQQCVDMWRANGILCAQVAPGNF